MAQSIKKRSKLYHVDGRPRSGRKFYTDKAEALAFVEELAKLRGDGGVLALMTSAALRQDASEAAYILAPWGRSLAEAARHYHTAQFWNERAFPNPRAAG